MAQSCQKVRNMFISLQYTGGFTLNQSNKSCFLILIQPLQTYPATPITITPSAACGTAHTNTRTLCARWRLYGKTGTAKCRNGAFEGMFSACKADHQDMFYSSPYSSSCQLQSEDLSRPIRKTCSLRFQKKYRVSVL